MQWSMWLAHIGIAVFLIGALGDGIFRTESISRVSAGQIIVIGDKTAEFTGISTKQASNYEAVVATLIIRDNKQRLITTLQPEKRLYPVERQSTTEAAIHSSISGDYYAVLGDGNATIGYTIRLYHKPFITWIWAGIGLMTLGGLISALTSANAGRKQQLSNNDKENIYET